MSDPYQAAIDRLIRARADALDLEALRVLQPDAYKNAALSRALYERAARPGTCWTLSNFKVVPKPWWVRVRHWLAERQPTFHFGPCDHRDCEG